MSAVIHIATEKQIHDRARRDALAWLRHVTASPATSDVDAVSACQVRLAIEYGKPPSEGARAWLVGLCASEDPDVGDEARNAARVARVRA